MQLPINDFSKNITDLRYAWDLGNGKKETWDDIAVRVVTNVFSSVNFMGKDVIMGELVQLISQRKFIPGGRFLAQAGRKYHQTNNCFMLRAVDTREGWGELMEKAVTMLMSGGGIGVDYSAIRENGAVLKSSGGTSSGPLPLAKVINEIGRGVMSGGKRRSAIYGSLNWNHPDIFDFISVKNWIDEVKKLKEKDFDFPASLDMTNISVILDKDFFDAYENKLNPNNNKAHKVYWKVVNQMVTTAEPGFQVDYNNKNESLRNA